MQAPTTREEQILARGSYREAMNRAGHLLARRSRSVHEMRSRLATAGFTGDVVEQVIERLSGVGLIDDADFARRWVAERSGKKGRDALLAELDAKGITRDLAEEALGEAGEEIERATEVASRHLAKLPAHLSLARQAARLMQALARRGFQPEVAEAATRAVLPPEGWD